MAAVQHQAQTHPPTSQDQIRYEDTGRTIIFMVFSLLLDINVSCYGYEGIDAVKAALKAGLARSTEELPIKINLIAPPLYVLTTITLDRTEGIARLNSVIQVIRDRIEDSDGLFEIEMEVGHYESVSYSLHSLLCPPSAKSGH